jgi:hypothetical protein
MKFLLILGLFVYVCYRFGRAILRFGQRLSGWVGEGYQKEGDVRVNRTDPRARKDKFGGDYVDYEEVK